MPAEVLVDVAGEAGDDVFEVFADMSDGEVRMGDAHGAAHGGPGIVSWDLGDDGGGGWIVSQIADDGEVVGRALDGLYLHLPGSPWQYDDCQHFSAQEWRIRCSYSRASDEASFAFSMRVSALAIFFLRSFTWDILSSVSSP